MFHGRRSIVLRCFALALMAVVAGDLLDAACDPLPGLTQTAAISAGSGSETDECSATCVADCYCCSGLDNPAIISADDPLGFVRMTTPPSPHRGPSRTTAPPDQPPTRL